MPTCNGKIKGEDGIVDGCPCTRYIPDPGQEASGGGPRNCRDCRHFESAHPTGSSQTSVLGVLESLKTRIDTVRHSNAPKVTPTTSSEEARNETYAGFRKTSNSSTGGYSGSSAGTVGRGGVAKYKKSPQKKGRRKVEEKWSRLGNIVIIPDAYAEYKKALEQESEHSGNSDTEAAPPPKVFSIPVPTANQIQQYKDSNLAAVSQGEDVSAEADHLAFKTSWSRFRIDMWLCWVLPKAMKWLGENVPQKEGNVDCKEEEDSSDSEYPWVLLVRERNKLVEFKKKGSITGQDLHTAKAPKGKRWIEQTVYIASKYDIPKSAWQEGHWFPDESNKPAPNTPDFNEDLSDSSLPPALARSMLSYPSTSDLITGKGKQRASETTSGVLNGVGTTDSDIVDLTLNSNEVIIVENLDTMENASWDELNTHSDPPQTTMEDSEVPELGGQEHVVVKKDIPLFDLSSPGSLADVAELPRVSSSTPAASTTALLPMLPTTAFPVAQYEPAVASSSTSHFSPFPMSLSTFESTMTGVSSSSGRKRLRSELSVDSGFADPGRPKNNPWKKRKI